MQPAASLDASFCSMRDDLMSFARRAKTAAARTARFTLRGRSEGSSGCGSNTLACETRGDRRSPSAARRDVGGAAASTMQTETRRGKQARTGFLCLAVISVRPSSSSTAWRASNGLAALAPASGASRRPRSSARMPEAARDAERQPSATVRKTMCGLRRSSLLGKKAAAAAAAGGPGRRPRPTANFSAEAQRSTPVLEPVGGMATASTE